MAIMLQATAMAGWQALVRDAESVCGRALSEDLQHYLTLLLHRFLDQPDSLSDVLALDYLQALETPGSLQRDALREVGDKCLLFSGLFPEQAEQRRVSILYYVELGKNSYSVVSQQVCSQTKLAQLFDQLRQQFVVLMDVLHSIREMGHIEPPLSLLQAYDLWEHSQSEYAKAYLERHTNGVLVKGSK